MTLKRAAVATVGALVVAAIGLKAVGMAVSKTDVEFVLRVGNDGLCTPSDPGPITAGFLNKVKWTIRNVDCSPQYIAIQNFRHPLGGGKYDPAETVVRPEPVTAGPIGTGQTTTIDARVIKFRLLHKLFKYDIMLGETTANRLGLDPDIDVWP